MQNDTSLIKLRNEINSLEQALIIRCRGLKVDAFKYTLRQHAEKYHRLQTIKSSLPQIKVK